MQLARTVVVNVRDGLHARPATQFVKLAKTFAAAVEVERGGQRANAKSSVKLMLLGVQERDEVTLLADGADADTALDRLAAFIASPESGLEPDAADAPNPDDRSTIAAPAGATPRGVAASEGCAIGPAFVFFPEPLIEPARTVDPSEIPAELARARAAGEAVAAELLARKNTGTLPDEDAEILDALVELARDTEMQAAVDGWISRGVDAVTATLRATAELATSFAAAPDPYLRARAEDVRNVGRSLALKLLGRVEVSLAQAPRGAVILADEIGAWDLAKADLAAIGGILCRGGSALSHVAIMARAHGVPAVVGCDIPADVLRAAKIVALDGRTGEVHLDPDPPTVARLHHVMAQERDERAALAAYRGVHPVTRDGRRICVAANLGTLREIPPALEAGAHGVGLFRTEFLFMERAGLPSEDEQARVYTRLAKAFAPHPVVIRTLDVGGDKPVAGIDFPREDNPFLGWRGVRMCLERPDVFKPQLRALLRAALVGNIRVMVPMIVDPEEVACVRRLIAECHAELLAEGTPCAAFALGVMVETPAAALLAPELAREVAFFSIGTNDLTQYVMAADRTNSRVARLQRTDHPAVLRAIAMVGEAALAAGIPVAVCGEAAGDPALIPLLVARGVTELSMSPAAITRAKKVVSEI